MLNFINSRTAHYKICHAFLILLLMNYSPGDLVLVLDTTQKAVGSAVVQEYHPETHQYTVLFQYPGKPAPEPISLPAHRVITFPQLATHP